MDEESSHSQAAHNNGQEESSIEISFSEEEFNRLYTKELQKKQEQKAKEEKRENQRHSNSQDSDSVYSSQGGRSRSRSREKNPNNKKWFIYDLCDTIQTDGDRFNSMIRNLPVFKKKDQILQSITQGQVVLITGETGCGKSTQVPRLLYEYIRATGIDAKIICVQPRRLAVKNLHKIMTEQIPEKNIVGYQIAMQSSIQDTTKILFMTNGIFLQKLVHSTEFFNQYPFLILDEVHERDIDTDFILLAIKRIMRKYPKLRVILMSATIDNKLFRYYFAEDEIDTFMDRQNFYKKFIKIEQEANHRRRMAEEQNDGYTIQRVGEEDNAFKELQMEFLKSRYPCPTINVTEKVGYKKDFFYLDTLYKFMGKSEVNMKWGSVCFSHKYPSMHKQLNTVGCDILKKILRNSPRDRSYQSALVFLPGLAEIQMFASEITLSFGKQAQNFQIVKCHSSILNDQVTHKLQAINRHKIKVIIATNIAESSITVMGVKYVIDFCLSKEVNFDQKSRMQNLQLVWASKASCSQRAGRTGRVCDGFVFRFVEEPFFSKFNEYSTPEIQRSSLDRLILRIKLIHQSEMGQIFEDPGDVLGTAIQPPNLKHIDQAIKELIICGGLRLQDDKLNLTQMGRIYVDIPLDIIYSRMLIFSLLMGTYEDILILVCIISQNKNPFRKNIVEKYPLDYFDIISNEERCDFLALVEAYKQRTRRRQKGKIQLDTYNETRLLILDVRRRINRRSFTNRITSSECQSYEQYLQRFKITIAYGFLNHLIRAYPMIHDDKQQKRIKLMKKQGISTNNTVAMLNSDIIKKTSESDEAAEYRLRKIWIQNIGNNFKMNPQDIDITLGYGVSFLHFQKQTDLNKLLFLKFIEKKRSLEDEKKRDPSSIPLGKILSHLGDLDFMEEGSTFQFFKEQKVTVQNYSCNRVIPVSAENLSQGYRLLLTNSIIQQNTRLSCRYTSLLPDIPNLQVILYLAFYPFVTLSTDKKQTRYQSLSLKKKIKLRINYQLDNEQIRQVNQLRETIKQLMDLSLFLREDLSIDEAEGNIQARQQQQPPDMEEQIIDPRLHQDFYQDRAMQIQLKQQVDQQRIDAAKQKLGKMKQFWPMLKKFIEKGREPIIYEQKWQDIYFEEKKIQQKNIPVKVQKQQQKQFMNEIRISLEGNQGSGREKMQDYENWKLQKAKEIILIEEKARDDNPYIICAACDLKIANLFKIGPITNQYFRQLFEHIDYNLEKLPYNELGDYFCSMLMAIPGSKQYDVYGCKNGHYLAIKFKNQKKLKLLVFSQINILYTDGSRDQQPEFQSLDYKKWRPKFQQSKIQKKKKHEQNYCFACNRKFDYIRDLEEHIRDQYHDVNRREFFQTIPLEKRKQVEKKSAHDDDGY